MENKFSSKHLHVYHFFETEPPNIPLPPQPIITRWGTWLEAALYYSDHFQGFSRIVNTIDKNEAVSI